MRNRTSLVRLVLAKDAVNWRLRCTIEIANSRGMAVVGVAGYFMVQAQGMPWRMWRGVARLGSSEGW